MKGKLRKGETERSGKQDRKMKEISELIKEINQKKENLALVK
jgi:hypothetical protein